MTTTQAALCLGATFAVLMTIPLLYVGVCSLVVRVRKPWPSDADLVVAHAEAIVHAHQTYVLRRYEP